MIEYHLYQIILYNDSSPSVLVASRVTFDQHPAENKEQARLFGNSMAMTIFGTTEGIAVHVIWDSTVKGE